MGVIVTAAGSPVSLAVDASGLYWSDAITGDVKKAALDGTGVVTLATAAVLPADFRGLALGVNDVYLAAASAPNGAIRKVSKAGGAVTDAATTPSVTVLTSLNGVPYWGDSAGGNGFSVVGGTGAVENNAVAVIYNQANVSGGVELARATASATVTALVSSPKMARLFTRIAN